MTTLRTMASSKVRNPDGNVANPEDREISAAIARRIVILCDEQRLSFRDVERRAGLADGTVAAICSSRRQGSVMFKTVLRIALALGTDVNSFCSENFVRRHGVAFPRLSAARKQVSLFEQVPEAKARPAAPKKRSARPRAYRKKTPPR